MKQYNILCATDNNFIPYCGVMLTSLFENNKEVKFNVFIISSGLNKKNITDFAALADLYQQKIEFIIVKEELLKNCPIRNGDHVSIATYYRIIAPQLLPQNIDKILYLDGDIIINGSIKNLYNTNIDNYALAAIIDEDHLNTEKYSRLNIAFNKSYINAGVLLINLKYWREHKLVDKCLQYTKENQEKIVQHDQDVLNAVLYDKIKLLPLKYNFQTGFLFKNFYHFDDNIKKEIEVSVEEPTIIHYTTIKKPWIKRCQHPFRNYFHFYRKKSLWKDTTMIDTDNFKNKIIYYIANIVWALKLKKRTKLFIIDTQKR